MLEVEVLCGPCQGPWSSIGPPPSGNYDTGSWQQLVWDKRQGQSVVHVRYWNALRRGEGVEIDVEMGQPHDPGVSDEDFFLDLAGSTGGRYEYVGDADPDFPGPLGACCLGDGSCVDPISESVCAGAGNRYKGDGRTCEDVRCILTVSEWGLAIMGLLLLTGAKVYFGQRRAGTTAA